MANPSSPIAFRVSDQSINAYNLRVLTSGIDTTAFAQNPVLLYMHRRGKVFGWWEGLTLDGASLMATPHFDTDDTDPEVLSIAGKVQRGILKAASIGIEILEVSHNEALGCYDVVKCRLVEISIVDIGANSNALKLYRDGEPLTELQLSEQLRAFTPADLPTPTTQPNPQPTAMLNLKTLALAAGLAETATEDEVSAAIVALSAEKGFKKKYEDLMAEQTAARTGAALSLVDAAVADGRIGATMKTSYLALFKLDHEGTAKILASLSKPVDLVELARRGGAANPAPTTDEEAVKAWDAHDKKGTLLRLQVENVTEFNRLFLAKFGKAPATK